MERFDGKRVLLTNYEVYSALKEVKYKKKLIEHKNLATIAYETNKYLENTPCSFQNSAMIEHFLIKIKQKGFRLTKSEQLSIINQRPTTLVELQLLIEENEERFSEEALQEILTIISSTLPIQTSNTDDNDDQLI